MTVRARTTDVDHILAMESWTMWTPCRCANGSSCMSGSFIDPVPWTSTTSSPWTIWSSWPPAPTSMLPYMSDISPSATGSSTLSQIRTASSPWTSTTCSASIAACSTSIIRCRGPLDAIDRGLHVRIDQFHLYAW